MDNSNAVYVRPGEWIGTGDFSDARVILVTPEDDRAWSPNHPDPACCYAGQAYDGPTFIMVGPKAADSSLANVSERYGIPLVDLQEFRAQMVTSHG